MGISELAGDAAGIAIVGLVDAEHCVTATQRKCSDAHYQHQRKTEPEYVRSFLARRVPRGWGRRQAWRASERVTTRFGVGAHRCP